MFVVNQTFPGLWEVIVWVVSRREVKKSLYIRSWGFKFVSRGYESH